MAGFDVARQPRAVRRRIGLVFREQTLDDRLTAEQNLRFHAVLYHVPPEEVEQRMDRALRLVGLVGLAERRHDLISAYSSGMARRLEIARGLLHTSAVLFLDEPTVGLDPQTRVSIWRDLLRMRRQDKLTIFLTTHYMDEAEYADRTAIIDHGLMSPAVRAEVAAVPPGCASCPASGARPPHQVRRRPVGLAHLGDNPLAVSVTRNSAHTSPPRDGDIH